MDFRKFCREPAWLPMGMGAGTALGVACGNLALWLALGVVFGLAMQGRQPPRD